MSLDTWKEEFYPVPAIEVKEEDALAHSLKKWEGLRERNLKAHDLSFVPSFELRIYSDWGKEFQIDSDTCALCIYHIQDSPADPCGQCPIKPCDGLGSPYGKMTGGHNPEPMIELIKSAMNKG